MRSRRSRRARSDSVHRPRTRSPSDNARLEIKPVALAHDAWHAAVVLADGRVVAGNLLAPELPPVVNRSASPRSTAIGSPSTRPFQAGGLDGLGDRRQRPVQHGIETVPRRLSDGECPIAAGDSCGHQTLPFRSWPRSVRGRSPRGPHARTACETGLAAAAPAPRAALPVLPRDLGVLVELVRNYGVTCVVARRFRRLLLRPVRGSRGAPGEPSRRPARGTSATTARADPRASSVRWLRCPFASLSRRSPS